MLHIKYCHGLECFVMRLQTFGVSRIFTRLGARMAEHRTARQVFSRFWWKQRYNSAFKTAVLCAISKDAIIWENLAVLVWGMYSLHAPLKHRLSTPVDLCMSHQSLTVRNKLIDFIRQPWYDWMASPKRPCTNMQLGHWAKVEDKKWHVACSCQIDHHPNETNANALCPALSRIAWNRWQKLKLKVEQQVKSEQKNTLLRFEGVYFFGLKKILKTFCWA